MVNENISTNSRNFLRFYFLKVRIFLRIPRFTIWKHENINSKIYGNGEDIFTNFKIYENGENNLTNSKI